MTVLHHRAIERPRTPSSPRGAAEVEGDDYDAGFADLLQCRKLLLASAGVDDDFRPLITDNQAVDQPAPGLLPKSRPTYRFFKKEGTVRGLAELSALARGLAGSALQQVPPAPGRTRGRAVGNGSRVA